MPKTDAPRTQRRKYVPPSMAKPKTVCVLLVRPDGKVLMLQQDDGVYSDPGGRIERGERWDDAARRLLLKETGVDLSQLLDIGARRIGRAYQKWSRADVQVIQVPDIPGGHQWRDPDDLVYAGKGRIFRDGSKISFRLDMNLKCAAQYIARCHPGRVSEEPLFAGEAPRA